MVSLEDSLAWITAKWRKYSKLLLCSILTCLVGSLEFGLNQIWLMQCETMLIEKLIPIQTHTTKLWGNPLRYGLTMKRKYKAESINFFCFIGSNRSQSWSCDHVVRFVKIQHRKEFWQTDSVDELLWSKRRYVKHWFHFHCSKSFILLSNRSLHHCDSWYRCQWKCHIFVPSKCQSNPSRWGLCHHLKNDLRLVC